MTAFMWALSAAFVWGVVPLLEKLGLSRSEPFTALFYRCFGVVIGLVLLGIFVIRPHHMKAVDAKTIFVLVLSGFLASFVAQILFYHGLKIGAYSLSQVLPDSVEDDDGVIYAVADYGKDTGDKHQVDFPVQYATQDGEDA